MRENRLGATAVVTVTYNSGRYLSGFLLSLRSSEPEKPLTVVADNGSSDEDGLSASCREFDAVFLPLGENLGYGGAINRAVATLPPEVETIVIANPDVEFRDGAVSALVAALEASDDVGSVGPAVLNSDGSVYPSARRLPSLRTGIGHALFGRVFPKNPWTSRYLADDIPSTETREAGWLSGSCLAVRRSAFEQIGGFDDGFFMYFEDVDLGFRLGKNGWRNLYVPSAAVLHTGAHSTTSESKRMLKAHHDSAYRYLARKYASWYLVPLRVVLHTGLRLRFRWLSRSSDR